MKRPLGLQRKKAIMKRLILLLLVAGFALPLHAQPEERPKNLILMIADGCGPASITMARDYARAVLGRKALALDAIQVGAVRTASASSRVTDSAAGATAYACGIKTYNGAIAVDTTGQPVATLLEAAKARDMAVGLVATSRITHATPAAFAAHVPQRAMESDIAVQMLDQGIEVLLGGGWQYFLPLSEGGRRQDGRNLLREAEQQGYQIVRNRAALRQSLRLPVLGLFAADHLPYEIDRDTTQIPSLAEMTRVAIELLRNNPNGFFLMVEGSRIDHTGHANDAAAHVRDVLAYDEAVAVALNFARQDGQTLVVSVSDHETGGLSLGRNVDGQGIYAWHPEVLARVRASYERLIPALQEAENPEATLYALTGIDSLTATERTFLAQAGRDPAALQVVLTELIGRRAVVGWTSNGHTAVDVNLYAYGPGSALLVGNIENDELGRRLAALMGFDLRALTEQLRQTLVGQDR
jgi:alkaline phosphatase